MIPLIKNVLIILNVIRKYINGESHNYKFAGGELWYFRNNIKRLLKSVKSFMNLYINDNI